MTGGARWCALATGHELLHHLLLDLLLKVGIVIVALVVLVLGMVAVWRRVGGGPPADDPNDRAGR